MAILLAHFPGRNTLALNPWTVYQLAADALRQPDGPLPTARSGQRLPGGPHGVDGADLSPLLPFVHEQESLADPRSRLAKVVRAFAARFQVTAAELAEHLSRFCKDADARAAAAGNAGDRDRPPPLRLTDTASGPHGAPRRGAAREVRTSASSSLYITTTSPLPLNFPQVRAAVQSALLSPFFDLLLSDRTADALRVNAGLLYWEFSRCVASLRSSDPFSRDRKAPLPTEAHLRARPMDCRVTASSALAWAEETAVISREEALLQVRPT